MGQLDGKVAIVTGSGRGIDQLAKEWGRYAVTVNCVAFDSVQTRLTKPLAEGRRAPSRSPAAR
jgi:NAD(P)-dependent dehydrogenase (short-subunit alcohol dehydrogenase family)